MDWATGLSALSDGMGSNAGPSMASGAAYGSDTGINVGGLTVNESPNYLWVGIAVIVGGALVWSIKK